jgi:hypothetical protein
MRFRTTIKQSGKTATGIQVPEEIVETLVSGKRPAVKVTINGYTYRSTVAVLGGAYMVGVSAEAPRRGRGGREPGHLVPQASHLRYALGGDS